MGLGFVLMLALSLLIRNTKFGMGMRATSFHLQHDKLMGINTNRVIAVTFAVGSMLAAASGILISVYYDSVYPTPGFSIGLKAFIGAVLGGIGSIPGAMFGRLLLGVAENIGATYLSSQYQDMIAFTILIPVLLIRPAGIMGRNETEKV
ncbi:hypothetical protein NKT34_23375 [Paenibacillus polysaccharolyticus]|nr:hypothetical protein [Paenibacillus polysaccharolyticus]